MLTNNEYKQKYIKYKQKYCQLKQMMTDQYGGMKRSSVVDPNVSKKSKSEPKPKIMVDGTELQQEILESNLVINYSYTNLNGDPNEPSSDWFVTIHEQIGEFQPDIYYVVVNSATPTIAEIIQNFKELYSNNNNETFAFTNETNDPITTDTNIPAIKSGMHLPSKNVLNLTRTAVGQSNLSNVSYRQSDGNILTGDIFIGNHPVYNVRLSHYRRAVPDHNLYLDRKGINMNNYWEYLQDGDILSEVQT